MVRRRSRKPKITGSNPVRACCLSLLCWGDFLGVGTTPPEGSPSFRVQTRPRLPLDQLFSPDRAQTRLPPSQLGWPGRDTNRLDTGTSSSLGAWCSGGGGGLRAGWGRKLQVPQGSPGNRVSRTKAQHPWGKILRAAQHFLHPEVPSVLCGEPRRCRTPGHTRSLQKEIPCWSRPDVTTEPSLWASLFAPRYSGAQQLPGTGAAAMPHDTCLRRTTGLSEACTEISR